MSPADERNWRPDIEGLRALAIIAVVADHAGVPFAQGGFIGVDVFFVLSGYLITGLLVRELGARGSIDFAAFYARRLQRLLPGLALMLVVASLAAAVLLAPYEQIPQTSSAMLAMLWLSNFFFGFADFGYFDAGSETNIYLHTWSLGVEEQFYLAWPLLLLWLHAGGAKDRLRRGLEWVLIVGFLISVVLTAMAPLWGFYAMPSRSWQFAVGALVFLRTEGGNVLGTAVATRLPALRLRAGWVGAALVVASSLFMQQAMQYPGVWALLPSLGAALIIFAGTGPVAGFGLDRLLTTAPMRFLGRISYSWYLWHWPVLVLGGLVNPDGGAVYTSTLVALSLLAATIAWFLLEQPVRSSGWLRARPAFMLTLAAVVMAVGAFLAPAWRSTANAWMASPEQAAYQALRSDLPQLYGLGCDEWFSSPRVRVCSFGEESAEKTAVLFGDSVGMQWFSAVAPLYADQGWRVLVLTKSACPIVDVPIFYPRIGAEYVVCEQWRNSAVAFLAEQKPDVVVMGSAADYKYSVDEWREGSARILGPLAAAAGKVYVIRGTPRLAFDGPGCLARQDWQPAFVAALSECASPAPVVPDASVFEALQAAAARFPNVKVVDFNALLCPEGLCVARSGDSIVFRDNQHIANRYVASLRRQVADLITAAD